jgi:hypothetical protein
MINRRFAVLFVVAGLVALACYTAGAQIVEDGLVSYWRLDEKKGGEIRDEVGPNNGTIRGNPKFVEGVSGKALQFSGDDAVFFENVGFPKGSSATTWSVWFKREVSAPLSQYIVTYGFWREPGGEGFGVGTGHNRADRLFMTQWGPNFDTFGPNIDTFDEWHYVAAVYDGKLHNTLYLDGEVVAERDLAMKPNVPNNNQGVIGANTNFEESMEGFIDEVGLYNRALTAEEVVQNFNSDIKFGVNPAGKVSTTWGKMKARP